MPSCVLRPKEVAEEVLATFTFIDLIAPFSYTKVPLCSCYQPMHCQHGVTVAFLDALFVTWCSEGKKALNVRKSAHGSSSTV